MADKPKKPSGGFKKSFNKKSGNKSEKHKKFEKSGKSGTGKSDNRGTRDDKRDDKRDDRRGDKRDNRKFSSDKKPSEPRRYDGLKKFENRKSDGRNQTSNRSDDREFEGPKRFDEKAYRNKASFDNNGAEGRSENRSENRGEKKPFEKKKSKYEQFDDKKFDKKKDGDKSWDKENKPWDKKKSDDRKDDRTSGDKPWEKKKSWDKKSDRSFDKPWDKKPWDKKSKSGGRGGDNYAKKDNFAPDGKYYIYGKHPVLLAIANPKRKIKKIFCSLNSHNFLIEKLGEEAAAKIPHEIFDVKQLDRMLPADSNHQGLILESEPLEQKDLSEVLDSKILILLDQITDPHNVGAIIRSSAAFGVGAVITTERSSPDENATIIKTSAGTFEGMPYIRGGNLNDTILKLKDAGFYVIGLAGEAEIDIKQAGKNADKIALIIGAEGKGLRELVGKNCDALAKINIAEGVESLNASVAAAVALYALSS